LPQSPEIELIDQLEGGPLPLRVVLGLFADREQAFRVLLIYVSNGIVRISRIGNLSAALREWEVRELAQRTSDQTHVEDDSLMVELTPEGASRWSTGEWSEM
jgi:hypothetical protein